MWRGGNLDFYVIFFLDECMISNEVKGCEYMNLLFIYKLK